MAQTVGTALRALADLLATVDPNPMPMASAVYVFPSEAGDIHLDVELMPMLIVSQYFGTQAAETIGRTSYGIANHRWAAEILLMVDGMPQNEAEAAAAEVRLRPWLRAVADVLWQNLTLSGTCRVVGLDQGSPQNRLLFRSIRQGPVMWFSQEKFGAQFILPIYQEYTQLMSA